MILSVSALHVLFVFDFIVFFRTFRVVISDYRVFVSLEFRRNRFHQMDFTSVSFQFLFGERI